MARPVAPRRRVVADELEDVAAQAEAERLEEECLALWGPHPHRDLEPDPERGPWWPAGNDQDAAGAPGGVFRVGASRTLEQQAGGWPTAGLSDLT